MVVPKQRLMPKYAAAQQHGSEQNNKRFSNSDGSQAMRAEHHLLECGVCDGTACAGTVKPSDLLQVC